MDKDPQVQQDPSYDEAKGYYDRLRALLDEPVTDAEKAKLSEPIMEALRRRIHDTADTGADMYSGKLGQVLIQALEQHYRWTMSR